MLRRARVDARARVVRPGEGEPADHRVAGEGAAHDGAGAGDEVEHAGRQAGVHEALDQAQRRERRRRGRLEDDGVAVDERRRDLPRGDGDREVPRRDRGHHAERLAAAVQHGVRRVGRQDVAAQPPALAGVVAQDVARPRDLAGRLGERLALLARERARDVAHALGEQFRRLEEDGAARRGRRGRPGRERLGRRGGGLCRVGRGRAGEHGEDLVVARRVPRLEAGVVARPDPLAADQVLAGLHRPPRRRDAVSPPRRNDTTDVARRGRVGGGAGGWRSGGRRGRPASPGSGTSVRSESRSVSR